MGLSISRQERKLLPGVVGKYGISAETSVRGLILSVSDLACFASLADGRWRYWLRKGGSAADSFADRVGRLLPMGAMDFMARINDHATGPVRPSRWKKPSGEAVVYDLADSAVVARFALACAIGEALAGSERLRLSRPGHAGAQAEVSQDALPDLNVNVSLWGVDAPGNAVVFFPDAVLLRRDRHQWVVPYAEIAVRVDSDGSDGREAELCLALSDQRLRLHVSDAGCARRAVAALEQLIHFEASKRAHLGPKPSADSDRLKAAPAPPPQRMSNTSCGRIVIKPKEEPAPEERIVINVKLGEEIERPEPEPDEGLATPVAPVDDELIFCDDSGLVFSTQAPASEEESAMPSASPIPDPPIDRLRAAVGALLTYVAKTSDGFTPPEQVVIREILQLPKGFPVEQRYSAVRPGSRPLAFAIGVVREHGPELCQLVLRECERVANADGSVTPLERRRLDELREALGG